MPKSKPRRKRNRPTKGLKQMKQDWQRRVLYDIFEGLKGPITQGHRDQAMKETGLPWRKIYKWIYDMDPILKRSRSYEFGRKEGERMFDYSRTKQIFKVVKVVKIEGKRRVVPLV